MYRSLKGQVLHPADHPSLVASLCATDPSEAQIFSAGTFLENVYGEVATSRAGTPMVVGHPLHPAQSVTLKTQQSGPSHQWSILGLENRTPPQSKAAPTPIAVGQVLDEASHVPLLKFPLKFSLSHMTKTKAETGASQLLTGTTLHSWCTQTQTPATPLSAPSIPQYQRS